MTVDSVEKAAAASVPAGFVLVRSGAVVATDLIYVYPGGGWLRADSPEWLAPVPAQVRDCTAVVRRPPTPAQALPGAAVRNYTLRRSTPSPAPAEASADPDQLQLF